MANGPTRVCVFNVKPGQQFASPVVPAQTGSNLIDIVTGCDGATVPSLGAASYGVPVVLNPNGVIDPSLLNTGVTAVAGVNLALGAPLIHLYSVGGVLTAEYADAVGSLSAQGFLTSPIDAGQPGTIAFSGLFTYIDPNSEFSLGSVGAEVYLSSVTPGGITLARPSSPNLDQAVGYVVAFAAPNVVTAIFLAGYNDFTRISGCLATAQLCSVQGTGAFVQLTGGAPPPSPVTTHLGVSANYAILAAAGITNAAPATSVTGGTIGSFPTTTITGFNPPTATVNNAGAAAALAAALAAYTLYSGLTFTSLSGSSANLSVLGNGANASTYNAGNYSAGTSMDIPTTITLDAQGNPNAIFVFKAGSTVTLESGASILLVNGAQAANVVWIVGSSFTSVATSTMVGNILANTSITLGGGILTGRALAGIVTSSGAVSIAAATAITVPSGAGTIIAGDIVTFDVNGNTLDSGISLAGVLSSIFVNPMTTAGDIIYETSGPLGPARLPIGATGQALTVVGGFPAWGNVVNSFNTRTGAVTFTLADIPQSSATTGQAIVWNGSAWVPSSAATTAFTDILTGTNTTATMTVGTGASIVVSGSGIVEATQLWNVLVSNTPPSVNQALIATDTTDASWQTISYSIISGTPTIPAFQVNGTPTTSQTLINFEGDNTYITASNPSAGNVLFTLDYSTLVTALETSLDTTFDAFGAAAAAIVTSEAFTTAAIAALIFPITFTPTFAGSPPEYEYLTGYNASTGLFSAAPLPPYPTVLLPGGSPTEIQFNASGVFGGIPGSSADGTNGLMSLAPTGTGVALTVTGDASGSDIQQWYAESGSPPTPAVAIDSTGNLHLNVGLFDSTGSLGTSGYVLSSTGTATAWIPIPAASSASTLRLSPIALTGIADAIDPHTPATYMVNTVAVDAMTIAAPTVTVDDGVVIQITTGTTGTPTLTCTGGTLRPGTAAVTTVLFAASPGSTVELMAYQGNWYVIGANNVTYA